MNKLKSSAVIDDAQLYHALKFIEEDDCEVSEFFYSEPLKEFLAIIYYADLVWVTSDGRVMNTERGKQLLELLTNTVEIDKKPRKIKGNYGNKLIKQ